MHSISRVLTISLALWLLAMSLPVSAAIPPGTRADMFGESANAVLIDTFADREVLVPGESFTLAVRVVPFENRDIKFHIYGAEPSEDFSYIPTKLVMDDIDGVNWGEIDYPPATEHNGQMWLSGQPVILIPGELDAGFETGPVQFTGRILVSACTEDMCLAPSQPELTWELEVGTAAAAAMQVPLTREELRSEVKIDMSRYSLPESEGELGGGLDLSGGAATDDGGAGGGQTGGGFDMETVDTTDKTELTLWELLLYAFLGGLILNVMPCVLPVISIKVIDLVRGMEKDPGSVVSHGLVFALGIVSTFLVGALAIIGIQAAGTQLGWGFQFQNPVFVLVMAAVIFIFGLSLADVFKLTAPKAVTAGGGELAQSEGYAGSFFKGVVATLLGTPCVGPFLGPALGAAFILGSLKTFLIFLLAGLGMALPYLILLPFLTKMGRRERGKLSRNIQGMKDKLNFFKHFMSFLLFGTVVYLLYILSGVMGGNSAVWAMAMLTGLGLAAWLYGRFIGLKRYGLLIALAAALIVGAASVAWFAPLALKKQVVSVEMHDGWEDFSLAKLEQYTAEGRNVLVDFTADWCPNCKYNEQTALNIESTMALKEELDFTFLYADWTQKDDEIGNVLRSLGFASVPLTAVFPGDNPNAPILLDGVFTPGQLHEAMRKAAGGT